ncbi:MAG TPA: hypothetical protein VF867_13295 [Arthrobacter sp.]
MTVLARTVIDALLTPRVRESAAAALSARGLGGCDPETFTGFVSWPTISGTCTLIHSPAAMVLISEARHVQAVVVGAAPYDTAIIRDRDWSVFNTPVRLAA